MLQYADPVNAHHAKLVSPERVLRFIFLLLYWLLVQEPCVSGGTSGALLLMLFCGFICCGHSSLGASVVYLLTLSLIRVPSSITVASAPVWRVIRSGPENPSALDICTFLLLQLRMRAVLRDSRTPVINLSVLRISNEHYWSCKRNKKKGGMYVITPLVCGCYLLCCCHVALPHCTKETFVRVTGGGGAPKSSLF